MFGGVIAPQRLLVVLFATSPLLIATTSACSDGDGDGGTAGSGGHAGSGSAAGGAGGHGGICKGCGDLLTGAAIAAAELCGFQGHGADNAVLCEPGSSCQRFADLHACMCRADTNARGACNDASANATCAMNACINGKPDQPCESCVTNACPSVFDACRLDVVSASEAR